MLKLTSNIDHSNNCFKSMKILCKFNNHHIYLVDFQIFFSKTTF